MKLLKLFALLPDYVVHVQVLLALGTRTYMDYWNACFMNNFKAALLKLLKNYKAMAGANGFSAYRVPLLTATRRQHILIRPHKGS